MAVAPLTCCKRVAKGLLACGALFLVVNEIRGVLLAAPVLYALWLSGGTLMAVWLAVCSLAGIALSVAVPWWIGRKVLGCKIPGIAE